MGEDGAWQPATLGPSVSPQAWTPWRFDWAPARAGEVVLRVRAIDATGQQQPAQPAWNRFGYGYNGVAVARLTVNAAAR